MGFSFSLPELESLNQRLWAYDVRDGGWQHEHRGAVYNAFHAGEEIRNVAIGRKSFTNPDHVAHEIAPDAIFYGLRLARWFGFDIETMRGFYDLSRKTLTTVRENQVPMPPAMLAYDAAGLLLGQPTHDAQHDDLREAALEELPRNARSASQLLLTCAELQVAEFGFDFDAMYNLRIADLRVRFGRPEPTIEQSSEA